MFIFTCFSLFPLSAQDRRVVSLRRLHHPLENTQNPTSDCLDHRLIRIDELAHAHHICYASVNKLPGVTFVLGLVLD